MGLLDGKNIVITGVLTDASLAFGVAKIAQEQGANIVLTGAGRALRLTQRTARKLGTNPDGSDIEVFELDVTVPEHGVAVRESLAAKWGRVDGVLHAVGFAPASCLGDDFMSAPWDDVAVAMHVSTYSLKALADAFVPLMQPGGSIVGLDFDNSVAWPAYNWMGVAKSALQSLSRYLAKELGPQGIRCNLVAAGPIRTMAAKSIPGFAKFEDVWDDRAGSRRPLAKSSTATVAFTQPACKRVPPSHRRFLRRYPPDHEPACRRDIPLPAATPRQSSRLVPVGSRGVC
jgi:meromycolic acid enoyl-[acyl-carrier-protein] reductase